MSWAGHWVKETSTVNERDPPCGSWKQMRKSAVTTQQDTFGDGSVEPRALWEQRGGDLQKAIRVGSLEEATCQLSMEVGAYLRIQKHCLSSLLIQMVPGGGRTLGCVAWA